MKRLQTYIIPMLIIVMATVLLACNSSSLAERQFPSILQSDSAEGGPICLQMVGQFYGSDWELQDIKQYSQASSTGTTLQGLTNAIDSLGWNSIGMKVDYESLLFGLPMPAILYWKDHYVVAYEIAEDSIRIADPAQGLVTYSKAELCELWYETSTSSKKGGIALVIQQEAFPSVFSPTKVQE